MKMFSVFAVISLIASLSYADTFQRQGNSDVEFNIAAVEELVNLVASEKNGSYLKMNFVVLDNGGSTDVSPKARLFLTAFNESEMMGAHSVHFIDHINSLLYSSRIEAGIYEAGVSFYDYDNICGSGLESKMKITIDARQLSMDVRNFKGVGEFGNGTITTPISITKTCL